MHLLHSIQIIFWLSDPSDLCEKAEHYCLTKVSCNRGDDLLPLDQMCDEPLASTLTSSGARYKDVLTIERCCKVEGLCN